ncbi:MAG: 2-oxoacid:acceptor oxidoreductase family protein [Dehalococcoidales bacterium]|nr:2-oxoacid:acceptor oxidoreductase family protein [Dehalococcoidales bacterium]
MLEIRWHGRGGQGAVTAAKLLASAAMSAGKNFQAFPEYGPERRGAPVQAFTRIDDDPIRIFSAVNEPDIVVVLDSTLIGKVPLASGLSENGILLANFDGSPEELRSKVGLEGGKVYAVNATSIAVETMGKAITNTPMVGALVRVSGVLSIDQVIDEVRAMFGDKLKASLVEANVSALRRAYEEVTGE